MAARSCRLSSIEACPDYCDLLRNAGLQALRLVIRSLAMSANDSLPDDVEALKNLLRARDAELARARAEASSAEALIAHLRLAIEKMRRELYGQRAERKARLLDQMELELEELEAAASEDELAAEKAAAAGGDTTTVHGFTRRKPSRKPFPEHLPRERVIVPGPTCCACCGSTRLAKLGEDVTETLEVVPRQWKVVQYVREKFTCRACKGISQVPAPFHVLPRGFAGPSLLAMILFEKYGQHQPLNRQAERYAREGVDLSLSTLAGQVGGCAMVLQPLYELIRAHVFAGGRVHGDDTPVPVLAKGKTVTGGFGPMFVMIGPSAAAIHRRRCSSSSRRLCGDSPSRCLRRIQPALCGGPLARADYRSCLLGPCEAQVFRARRCHRQGTRQAAYSCAAGAGSSEED
jgi:transposase